MKFHDLRPHQQKAVSLLRSDWKKYRTHQISAPVAFGKTALAAYLVRSFIEKGMRVMFTAPYTTLVNQTATRFEEYGLPKAGIVWRDHPDTDPKALIQIASADTLIRRDFPKSIDLLIVDESHIRRIKMLDIIQNSSIPVIGLSGTPFAKWMGNAYENFIKPSTMRELIDQGFLSDYEFYAPTKPDLKGVKTSNTAAFGNDYKEQDLEEIMNGHALVGDIVSHWMTHGQDRQTIAFCVNVAHANHVCNTFNSKNVTAEVMTAKTPQHERDEIIARFELGVTKVICNVGVLVAGFDSDVRCLIYARPTKSEIRWIQCLGRSLRAVDKVPAIYYEYLDRRESMLNDENSEAAKGH